MCEIGAFKLGITTIISVIIILDKCSGQFRRAEKIDRDGNKLVDLNVEGWFSGL